MKMKQLLIFPLILIILFGGIAVASGLGVWKTESTKVPKLIKEGAFEGEYNPEDIRGSYSFQDIENAFNVPANITAQAFGIGSDSPGNITAKDIEEIYGETEDGLEVGTGAIRTFVAYYVGMEYPNDEGIPQEAVDILKAEGKWSDELDVLFEGKIIDLSQFDNILSTQDTESETEGTQDASSTESNETEEHDESEQVVKGNTTVAEVVSWGISLEIIEEILTVKVENENMLIQEICNQNDLSFSQIKTTLNALLEK